MKFLESKFLLSRISSRINSVLFRLNYSLGLNKSRASSFLTKFMSFDTFGNLQKTTIFLRNITEQVVIKNKNYIPQEH